MLPILIMLLWLYHFKLNYVCYVYCMLQVLHCFIRVVSWSRCTERRRAGQSRAEPSTIICMVDSARREQENGTESVW